MTLPSTVADAVKAARAAIAAGNYDEAEQFTNHAKALKALEGVGETQPRLDLTTPAEPAPGEHASQMALKSWYKGAFGADLDKDAATLMGDLYGGDYRAAAWTKRASFLRYVRTGQMDEWASRIVFTPEQVMAQIAEGKSYSEVKATQVESQDSLGGFLVPEDVRDEIVKRIQGLTPMRSVAQSITTGRDRVSMPVVTGGDDRYIGAVRVEKVDESPTSSQAETNATFGNITIPVHTVMGHTTVSKNLLEDSTGATGIVGLLTEEFSTAYAIFEDEQFLVGNGVGGPQGILKNATTGGPNTYSYGSIATLNSGGATELTADAIRKLPLQVPTQYRSAGGMWLMSRGTLALLMTLKAGDGTYLWSGRSDAPQLSQGQPQQLGGFPVKETEVLASPNAGTGAYAANTYPILFVTRPSYLIVDRPVGGMAVERYEDFTTARTNTVGFVLRRRVGGQVVRPWGVAAMKIAA
jgi:HK97 family phage major capsid protein